MPVQVSPLEISTDDEIQGKKLELEYQKLVTNLSRLVSTVYDLLIHTMRLF